MGLGIQSIPSAMWENYQGAVLYEFTAAAAQTSVSGADDNGNTLAYTVGEGNYLVLLNGVKLNDEDYTATTGTSFTGLAAMTAGWKLEVLSFGEVTNPNSYAKADTYTKTEVDAKYALNGANADITSLTGLTTPLSEAQGGTGATSAPTGNNPNLIINGGMTVSQRGTVTGITSTEYTAADRWQIFVETTNAIATTTVEASPALMAAAGFPSALKVDCTTVESSLAGSDFMGIQYKFEGQDVQHLLHGTSGSLETTISFWWQSPKAGTQVVFMVDNDNNYGCPMEFTVTAANTAEYFTVTFPAQTSGSALPDDNTYALSIGFPLLSNGYENTADTWTSGGGWRSTTNQQNLMDNTANNVYLTGVKLEVASAATSFEHESYGDTLAKCQRYYERFDSEGLYRLWIDGSAQHSTYLEGQLNFAWKRTNPTVTCSAITNMRVLQQGGGYNCTSFNCWYITHDNCNPRFTTSGLTIGNGALVQTFRNAGAGITYIEIDAEL